MNIKGVSWVGDMRQRFEALCVEVDETIYEDTVNYVGNQMRTVKESVKNFYSEVMQDLRASSSLSSIKEKYTPGSVARKGNAVICRKPKIDNNNYESVDAEQIANSYDGAAITDKSVSHGSCHSVEEQCTSENSQSQSAYLVSNQSTIVENYLTSRQEEDPQLKPLSDSSRKDYVEESVCSKSQNGRDESLCGCGDISSSEASVLKVIDSNENETEMSGDIIEEYASASVARGSQREGASIGGVSTDLDDATSSTRPLQDTTIIDNVGNAVKVHYKFYVSEPGADKQGRLKLDESCVMVEKEAHFPKSTLEDEQKSYKKKIKEAFFSSRWTKSKKNPEQLVGMYEEQSGKSLSCTGYTDIQNIRTSEPFESEWELL